MNRFFIIIILFSISYMSYLDFEITVNENPYNQDIFVSHRYEDYQYLSIIDTALSPKWYVVLDDNKGWDFKVNNNNHLSYYRKQPEGATPTSSWYIMNSHMQEVDTLDCANGYMADYHDIQYTEDDGYILMAYAKQVIDIPETVSVDTVNVLIIQEFDQNHNLLFEWNNSDHMNIQDYVPSFNLNTPHINWTHGNSIEIDGDGLIISNRAMSEVIKYNRYNGSLVWTLGGPLNDFTFINDPLNGPHKQHDARRLENGNLMIFDNGHGGNNPRPARVSEYEIDEQNLIATLIWEYSHPEGYVSQNQGSSQRLENGNTLISWGGVAGHGSIITEVSYNKDIQLELRYPLGAATYKVRKSDWDFDINLIEGDLNLDGVIDILDLISSVNYILSNNEHAPFYYHKIDINKDSNIDVLDLVEMINIIISS